MKNKELGERMETEEKKVLRPAYSPSEIQASFPAPPPLKSKKTHIPTKFARDLAPSSMTESACHECYLSCWGKICGIIGTCCSCCCDTPYRTVPQGKAGIQTRFGRAYRILDPGMYYVNPVTEKIHEVNVKVNITDIPRQLVITKDNIILDIDSVLYWHAVDPFATLFNVDNIIDALTNRTITTLRATIGSHDLQVLVEDRQQIAKEIHRLIHDIARAWGVVVESILINDLKFTKEIDVAMASVAKQERIGESKVIAAKAEVEAAKLTREASEFLNTPSAIKMRQFETMNNMSRNSKTKVVYISDTEGGMQGLLNAYMLNNMIGGIQ